jgi:hypothetical protein
MRFMRRRGLSAMDDFRDSVREITLVLDVINEAEQTPDLLEIEVAPNGNAADNQAKYVGTVTSAEHLYASAVLCRKVARRIAGQLHQAGWRMEDEELFFRAFENLADVWSTYKKILDYLKRARWDGEPSLDQVLIGLERPRRRYLAGLDAYRVQLLVVEEYLNRAVDYHGGKRESSVAEKTS